MLHLLKIIINNLAQECALLNSCVNMDRRKMCIRLIFNLYLFPFFSYDYYYYYYKSIYIIINQIIIKQHVF